MTAQRLSEPHFATPPAWLLSQVVAGSRYKGLAYERKVGRVLNTLAETLGWGLLSHQWIHHAGGWLQPDFILVAPSESVIIFECKLTWHSEITAQTNLYENVLREMGYSPITVTVVRNTTPYAPECVYTVEDIYPGCVWHLTL